MNKSANLRCRFAGDIAKILDTVPKSICEDSKINIVAWNLFYFQCSLLFNVQHLLADKKSNAMDYLIVLVSGVIFESAVYLIWIIIGTVEEQEKRAQAYLDYYNIVYVEISNSNNKKETLNKINEYLHDFKKRKANGKEDDLFNIKAYHSFWYQRFGKKFSDLINEVSEKVGEKNKILQNAYRTYCYFKHASPCMVLSYNTNSLNNCEEDWLFGVALALSMFSMSEYFVNPLIIKKDLGITKILEETMKIYEELYSAKNSQSLRSKT